MAKNRDKVADRLLELFAECNETSAISRRFFEERLLKPAGLDWTFFNKDVVRCAALEVALRLDPSDSDYATISVAFEKSGLDPKLPLDWRRLLSLFAESHFGQKEKAKKWTDAKLVQLYFDYREVKLAHSG